MSAVSVAVTVNGGPGSNVFDTVNWMVTVHDVDAHGDRRRWRPDPGQVLGRLRLREGGVEFRSACSDAGGRDPLCARTRSVVRQLPSLGQSTQLRSAVVRQAGGSDQPGAEDGDEHRHRPAIVQPTVGS